MRIKFIIPLILLFLAFGCASQKPMYYFGDYSNTLYQIEKNQTNKSISLHQEELEKIIEKSKKLQINVPPGIYAELGFILLKSGKNKEAVKFFQEESNSYPESKHLMDRLIFKIETQKKNNEDKI